MGDNNLLSQLGYTNIEIGKLIKILDTNLT